MTTLVILTLVDIVLLVAGLAVYLFWAGTLLNRIAANLEESAGLVGEIAGHAEVIKPAVEHINRTGGVVAGALPLLYGMAEGIVAGVTHVNGSANGDAGEPHVARPASGRRRSRLTETVGFAPAADAAGMGR